jgi:hypothetical protein
MEFVYSILERERPARDVGDRFWTRVQLTLARQSETVGSTTGLGGRDEADQDGGNLAGFYRGSFAARIAQASPPAATDADSQVRVRRSPRRVPVYPRNQPEPDGVYPRYFPGRNAVRECTATYVQEYRPSGTVIVPRMNCYWRGG